MIELHCHLLPGLDDGPPDLAGSLALARALAGAGVQTAVATPHVDLTYGLGPDEIARAAGAFTGEIAAAGVPLEVRAGGEVNLRRLFDLTQAEREALTLGGGPWLLVECPLGEMPDVDDALIAVHERGPRVLLAHPERCPALQRAPERLRRLVGAGLLAQVTAGALWGEFGASVRAFAHRLVAAGLVHVMASDAHHAERRPPRYADAARALRAAYPDGDAEVLRRWLCEDVPQAVVGGSAIPPRPAVEARAQAA
jgi:protein-tyrosine phosphatase